MAVSRVMAAAMTLARHFPGGAAGLGNLMGKSNLADELNPNLPRSKLGLDDAVEMELLSNDSRILRAHAEELRHFPPIPMPEGFDANAVPCMQAMAATLKEFADLVAAVTDALGDGQVTDPELLTARKEWDDVMVAGAVLMAQMAAMNRAGKRQAGDGR